MNEFEYGQLEDPTPFDAMDAEGGGDAAAAAAAMNGGMMPGMQGPPPPVYNLQPPIGISVTTPSTVPQAFQPQQMFPKVPESMIGSGMKGPKPLVRIHMGLQSQVTSEIDWSLTTLLTYTTSRDFEDLKARVDIMVLVIAFINDNWAAVTKSQSDFDDDYDTLKLRQKVLDAMLIIRNVCIDQSMAKELAGYVAPFVERTVLLPQHCSLYTEMRLLGLEISEHTCYYFFNQLASETPFFQGLVKLLNSTDKSVLVSAMRSVTRLLVFDARESSPLLAFPQELVHATRALYVDDADLVAASLDLLIQFTARLQRVEQMKVADEPRQLAEHLVRLLSFRMERGPTDYLRLPRRTRKPAPVVPPEIPASIMAELLTMNEPARATMWIRSSYDTDPDGEVMQVALWTGYQRSFEPHERDGTGKKMLKAIDFIRTCTTNVRGAQAKVVTLPDGQRKFIIKGLVPREKAIPPSQLLGTGTDPVVSNVPQQPTTSTTTSTANQAETEEERPNRAPPIYGTTVATLLTNIAKLQGGKELLEPLVGSILEALYVNPSVSEPIDRLLIEIGSSK